jgi:hypothetical protein
MEDRSREFLPRFFVNRRKRNCFDFEVLKVCSEENANNNKSVLRDKSEHSFYCKQVYTQDELP